MYAAPDVDLVCQSEDISAPMCPPFSRTLSDVSDHIMHTSRRDSNPGTIYFVRTLS